MILWKLGFKRSYVAHIQQIYCLFKLSFLFYLWLIHCLYLFVHIFLHYHPFCYWFHCLFSLFLFFLFYFVVWFFLFIFFCYWFWNSTWRSTIQFYIYGTFVAKKVLLIIVLLEDLRSTFFVVHHLSRIFLFEISNEFTFVGFAFRLFAISTVAMRFWQLTNGQFISKTGRWLWLFELLNRITN